MGSGLSVLDVSDPGHPVRLSVTGSFSGIAGVTTANGQLVTLEPVSGVDHDHEMRFYTLSEGAWVRTASKPVGANANRLLGGDGLVIVGRGEVLEVYGVGELSGGVLLSTVGVAAGTGPLIYEPPLLYTGSEAGVIVYDLSAPEAPVLTRVRAGINAGQMVKMDGVLLCQDGDWIRAIDADPSGSMGLLSTVAGSSMVVSGRTVLTGSDLSTSEVVSHDFTDPGAPVTTRPFWIGGHFYDIVPMGDGVFGYPRVYTTPELTGGFVTFRAPTGGGNFLPWRPAVSGQDQWSVGAGNGTLYMSQRVSGGATFTVYVYSLADPSQPTRVKILNPQPTNYRVEDFAFSGDVVYASHSYAGIMVLDASTPTNPQIVRDVPVATNEIVYDMCMANGRLLAAADRQGVSIFTLEDPLLPTLAGHIDGRVKVVAGAGDRAFTTLGNGTISVYDIADPAEPELLGETGGTPVEEMVAIDEDTFVAAYGGAFEIWDVSTPSAPVVIGEGTLPSDNSFILDTTHLRVEGDRVYLSAARGPGLYGSIGVFDISDPAQPVLLTYAITRAAGDLAPAEGILYVGTNTSAPGGSHRLAFALGDCCPADLADPRGSLDTNDLAAFLTAYGASDAGADLAEPFGVWNFFDVGVYLSRYREGCP